MYKYVCKIKLIGKMIIMLSDTKRDLEPRIYVECFDNLSDTQAFRTQHLYPKYRNTSGIYCLHNKITGRKYVGQYIAFNRRMLSYFSKTQLFSNISLKNRTSWIYQAIRDYGIENFRLYILDAYPKLKFTEPTDRKFLDTREHFWVEHIRPTYNIQPTGLESNYAKVTQLGKDYRKEVTKQDTASRKELAKRMGRTTLIDCYDFYTNKYLFTFEGVRNLASVTNFSPGTLRLHLNKGSRFDCNLGGKNYSLKIVRQLPLSTGNGSNKNSLK